MYMFSDAWFESRINWLEEPLSMRDRFLARMYMTVGLVLGLWIGALLIGLIWSLST